MTDNDLNLTDSPLIVRALNDAFAIPTCTGPGCDGETEPFTDRCTECLTGDAGVFFDVEEAL